VEEIWRFDAHHNTLNLRLILRGKNTDEADVLKRDSHSTFPLFAAVVMGSLLGFFSQSALAATTRRILRIAEDEVTAFISQQAEDPVVTGEMVCAFNKDKRISCGKVVMSNETEAKVYFPEDGERPLVGDNIQPQERHAQAIPKRTVATATDESPKLMPSPDPASELLGEEEVETSENSPQVPESVQAETKVETKVETEAETEDDTEDIFDDAVAEGEAPTPAEKPTTLIDRSDADNEQLELIRYHRALIQKYNGPDTLHDRRKLKRTYDITVGMSLYGESSGSNVWPTFLYQWATSRNSAFGLQGGYSTFGGSSLSATNYYAMLNYHYYANEPFRGPTARMGIGLGSANYSTDTVGQTLTGTTMPIVAMATVGYRWLLDGSINIGLEGGIQLYQISVGTYFRSSSTTISTATSSVTVPLPVVLLDVGFSF